MLETGLAQRVQIRGLRPVWGRIILKALTAIVLITATRGHRGLVHMGRPQPHGLFVVPAQLVHICCQPATHEHATIRVVIFARAGLLVLITAAGLTLPYPALARGHKLVLNFGCGRIIQPIRGCCSCAKANLALTLTPSCLSYASLT